MQRRSRRRDKERWVLPIDRNQHQEQRPRESTFAVASYALGVGLVATLLGVLASIVVPGRAFLVVWAVVTLAVSAAAGWHAGRVRTAARRLAAALLKG